MSNGLMERKIDKRGFGKYKTGQGLLKSSKLMIRISKRKGCARTGVQ
jgi:hypothetical protein